MALSTRLVDNAIQALFRHGSITVVSNSITEILVGEKAVQDHHESLPARDDFWKRIAKRLELEHPDQFKYDRSKRTIWWIHHPLYKDII